MSTDVTIPSVPRITTQQSANRSSVIRDNVWRAAVLLALVLLWALLSSMSDLVASPTDSLNALAERFADGSIYRHLNATLQAVAIGFLIAAAIGFPLGYAIGRSKFLGAVFDPIVAGAFAIPRVIFFPILLQIFGVGVGAQSAMAALAAVFPIMVSTTAGVRAINPLLPKLARSLSLSPLQTVTKIYVPAMAPSLMVGIRIGFSIAFINVIIAEFFAARAGLGLLALRAYGMLDLPTMYGIIVLLAAIALAGNLALWAVERRLGNKL
ncbi:ABC transporter permease [Arthrobacter sp. BB-1]|uniref:ABC transporter permease n=1 Tax=unclassified Arthrobacter TaxID=235627 RepID=UPI0011120FD2|nr:MULTISPECIES: ABC transporter permease [unclassified Arthrobacter]TNB72994.1 ABC transporter permease [Arthrobacter sp. BB-1]